MTNKTNSEDNEQYLLLTIGKHARASDNTMTANEVQAEFKRITDVEVPLPNIYRVADRLANKGILSVQHRTEPTRDKKLSFKLTKRGRKVYDELVELYSNRNEVTESFKPKSPDAVETTEAEIPA